MPLAAGFVGVIPAMAMLGPEDGGAHTFTSLELVLWSLALASFGVFAAVPLRKQVIEREKLRFPSGTATAEVIRTLHASAPTSAADAAFAAGGAGGSLGVSSPAWYGEQLALGAKGARSAWLDRRCPGGGRCGSSSALGPYARSPLLSSRLGTAGSTTAREVAVPRATSVTKFGGDEEGDVESGPVRPIRGAVFRSMRSAAARRSARFHAQARAPLRVVNTQQTPSHCGHPVPEHRLVQSPALRIRRSSN